MKKQLFALIYGIILFYSSLPNISSLQLQEGNDLIINDRFWKDTNGNFIYSQGGGVFKFGDTYYWYGVHYKGAETYAQRPGGKNSDTSFVSITCYSSKDLVNWKFENDVLTPNSRGWIQAGWVGRMGVAYCPRTKLYVLITQHDDNVLFATCDRPNGNFEVKNRQHQIQNVVKTGTGDQTVFIDDDGQAYLIFCNQSGRGNQYVAKLRESDFLEIEPAVMIKKGQGREGNCMFKYKGKYYFCASDLHGWNSSHSYYMVADNIFGPYSDWMVMQGSDDDFSHVTQTGFFYTIKGTKQDTVLFCGDRWSDFAGNGLGYNQWVPLTVNGNSVKFNSVSEFHLNAETGEWEVGEKNNWILNPSFEADRVVVENIAGWKFAGIGISNISGGRTGNFCLNFWSDQDYKSSAYQDINLPNGIYTFKGYARYGGTFNEIYFYIKGADGEDKRVSIKTGSDWKEFTITDIEVKNGKCQVGIYCDGKANAWVRVDDLSLISQ